MELRTGQLADGMEKVSLIKVAGIGTIIPAYPDVDAACSALKAAASH